MDDVPPLKDLCEYVIPRYSADWKVIGILLGLHFNALRTIEKENPSDNESCCNQILKVWKESSDAPSWNSFFAAIESPPSFNNCHSIKKGIVSTISFYMV